MSSDGLGPAGTTAQEMGFFSWLVPANKLHADATFGRLYAFDKDQLSAGIGVEEVLDRVIEEDRPKIARGVHHAIVTGEPSSAYYRITLPDGSRRDLVSFGTCFRDEDGVPSIYTGTVMDASLPQVAFGDDPLKAHCLAALELAEKGGQELAVRYLSSALASLTSGSLGE